LALVNRQLSGGRIQENNTARKVGWLALVLFVGGRTTVAE
jgi:hypothetical protein